MPMFKFKCTCGAGGEELYGLSDEVPTALDCPLCDKPDGLKQCLPLLQRTPGMWGDQMGKHGVNGVYDRGLGAVYYSNKERERIAKSKGLVAVNDISENYLEDVEDRHRAEKLKDEARISRYLSNVRKFGGDTIRAMTETFPAKQCLAGDFD